MANARKRISELTALTSASLDTVIVGVDNGTTYKIELDVLADAVTSRVNILDRSRLSSLESVTSSFESKGRSVISSSAQISAFGFISSSHTDITSLNSFTSSFGSFSSSVHNEIVAATNEQDLLELADRIDNLEANSGSYLTSLSGAISSSSQLTSSYDERYVLSGSITQTTWDNIANKPDGIVSQSVDIANFTFTTDTITNGAITLQATNSDIVLDADGAVYIGSSNAGNQIITDSYLAGIIGDTEMINNGTGNTISNNLTNIINSIPTIPDGIISGSEQITAFGFISSSQTIDTGSLATTGSNTFNGNQTIDGSLTINFSNGIPTGVTNWNGQGGWNQGFYSNLSTTGGTGTGLTVDVAAGGGGYIAIEQITINTAGSGYTNGDIITIDNENNLPGTFTIQVGGSSLQFNSSSVELRDLTLNGTGSFQSDLTVYGNLKVWGTQSIINSTNVELSDNILYLSPTSSGDYDLGIVGHYNDGTYSHTGIFSDASDGYAWKVFKGLTAETTGAFIDTNGVGYTLADFKANNIYGGIHATNNVVSGSSQLTSSYDTRYTLSGSVSAVPSGTISGSAQITAFGFVSSSSSTPAGTISGSAQITTFGFVSGSYETTGRSIFSGSSQITGVLAPSNLSTSGQVSASVFVGGYLVPEAKFTVISSKPMTFWPNSAYEAVRFTTSNNVIIGGFGSVVDYGYRLDVSGSMRVWGNTTITGSILGLNGITGSIAATNGVVSGSTQILNYNILATTGSNSFNGNQTITGSLNVSSIAVVSSSFTANSSSLTLNSGSNLYVQNNGIVEITGSLIVSGSTIFKAGGGFEGGEIALAYAPSGSTLTGSAVSVDIYQNRLRIFEGGGNARGVYVDLSKAPNGVAGELLWKASGLVNAGVDVTLGNLKARLASSGNYSLQLSTVSGTYSVYGSSVYSYNGIGGVTLSSPLSITTTPTYLSAGYNFLVAGSTDTWNITDTSAGIAWRITLMIGPSFTNNMISIERLV